MTVNVAVLDGYSAPIRELIRRLTPTGWRLNLARSLERTDQLAAVRDATVVFTGWCPVDEDLIAQASGLRFVQKLGAGVDKIDADACRSRGIVVARLAGGNAIPVAEHVVLLMLATMRRLPTYDVQTRAGAWLKEEARGTNRQLEGKRVGLVGMGNIGRAVARRLSGFGVDLWYYDVVRPGRALEQELGLTYASLTKVLATSDVVSLHLPLLPETTRLIDAAALRRMKDGAILVNCGRGGLVDEEALAAELSSGRLFGAGLDVYATEPPHGSVLLTLPNTVVTPHLAGATVDNFEAVLRRAFDNARAALLDAPLPAADVVIPGRENAAPPTSPWPP